MKHTWKFVVGGMVGAAALLGGQLPVRAQMAAAPATVMSSRIIAQGTVEKVDHQARTMTLRLGTGEKLALNVSPQATEFSKIRRGDPVTVDYLQAVSVSLEPSEAAPELSASQQSQNATQAQAGAQQEPAERGATEAGEMMHAKPGSPSAPGAVESQETEAFESAQVEETYRIATPGEEPMETIVRVEELTAPIESVDQQARIITLRGPDGLVKLHVSGDAGPLTHLQAGDRITTRFTKAMALDVRKSG